MTTPTYLTLGQLLAYQTPVQRSAEWFELRSKYLTSSDLGTVLGFNKYKSVEELYNEKTGIIKKEFTENDAIKHGLVPFTQFQDPDKMVLLLVKQILIILILLK